MTHNRNGELACVFEQLRLFEAKVGSPWAARAYAKVAAVVRAHPEPITSGADLAAAPGVGKASVGKVDEYLANGVVAKLEEFIADHGAVADVAGADAAAKFSIDAAKAAAIAAGPVAPSAAKKDAGGKPTAAGKKKKAAAPKLKPVLPTKSQLATIAKRREALAALGVAQLKDLLRLNDQTTTGNKPDLVDRCAQGAVLGALPRCPLCGAGRVRFDKAKAYYCPGYMDDDEFQPCTFVAESVERAPWQHE